MTQADEQDGAAGRLTPLGAPTDPMRPTGRVANEALAESKAAIAARGRRALRWIAFAIAAAVLLALLFFTVASLLPKPDL